MKKKNSVKLKSKETQEHEPIVFVNRPLEEENKDVIGFGSIKESIDEAVKKGAKMISVIADYGAGKSSLVELLSQNTDLYRSAIIINLWDSLQNKPKGGMQENVSELTKSFLYQLASGSSDKKGNSKLARYVNKD